ncbi:restriction endonuclease subunit S [Campylobacter lanienae]|uniref:restriction endonuclease subunit S n=1 Tax=Campylobacter lanienae TaxID=75658 RepID=UPI00112F6506|nr:restriction endonuclease subunit S [Campylobacter lanienae]
MSKLEELINKLCPNGVEFKKLSEVCNSLKKGTLKTSDLNANGKYPVINSGRELYGFYDEYNNKNAITLAARGEYAGYISYFENEFWAGGLCYPYSSKNEEFITNKFLYYYLKKNENKIMENLVARGSIPALNKSDLDRFLVPVPPLEVQCEIVRILDNFTLLSAELSAELSARQKQYEYYRDELLTFNKKDENVKWEELGKYCQRLKGTAITARSMKEINKENGKIRIFAGGKTMINTTEHNIPSSDIIRIPNIIVQSRGIIDFIYYEKPCSFKREMWSYTHTNSVTLKFIYYYLKKNIEYFKQRGNQMGSMPQISLEVTEKFKIPLPSMNKQERIVNILDRFDKLCNDISEGLPAEIEARKKQYEYYRDKLLTFKELKDNE